MGDQSPIMDLRTFGRTMLGRQPGYRPTKQELAADIALYKQYQMEAVKQARPAFTPAATEVALPDGRKVAMIGTSPNSAMVAPSEQSWKPMKVVAPDGTVKLVDENTGRAITAWDENTGQPVKSVSKNAEDLVQQTQAQNLAQEIAKIQSGSGFYLFGNRDKAVAAKQAELNAMLNPSSVLPGASAPASRAMPSPTAQATPTPDRAFLSSPVPSPTPDAAPSPSPISMSSADYQSKYGRTMKPGRYRTKSGAEVLITD